MNKENFDVVIIGAGPSGAVASAILARAGRSVLVLEKQIFPRFSIGESLLPQCMVFLEQAGLVEHVHKNAKACGFQFKNGAAFHKQGQNTEFDFRHTADMWLNYYNDRCRKTNLPEIAPYIPAINAIYAKLKGDEIFHKLLTLSESLHSHGDVAPKNFITTDDQEKVLFDFNNAFYGPKIADVLDGAFEVALSEKYMDLIDFSRFHDFIAAYRQHGQLAEFEVENMNHWINFIGIIKFAKEVRAIKGKSSRKLRVARARGIAEFLQESNA